MPQQRICFDSIHRVKSPTREQSLRRGRWGHCLGFCVGKHLNDLPIVAMRVNHIGIFMLLACLIERRLSPTTNQPFSDPLMVYFIYNTRVDIDWGRSTSDTERIGGHWEGRMHSESSPIERVKVSSNLDVLPDEVFDHLICTT